MSKKNFSEENFWRKLRCYFGNLTRPALIELLSLYYCLQDSDTPFFVKSQIVAALGYFILPTDLIPDVFLAVGYSDDLAIIASTYAVLNPHIKAEHKEKAIIAIDNFFS